MSSLQAILKTDGEFMATALKIKKPKTARSTLNIRILPQERNLIDQAARARCKNRTDFILDAARQAAEETLLDRAMISVSPQAYQDFLERLNAPPQPNERLLAAMRAPVPWDTK
jgi:uncharacterized protein (DUF1778 family)